MSLEERAEEAARGARCTRCDSLILMMPTPDMIASGRYRRTGTAETVYFSLCGPCGEYLSDFLAPSW